MTNEYRKTKKYRLKCGQISLLVIMLFITTPSQLLAETRLERDLRGLAGFVNDLLGSVPVPKQQRLPQSSFAKNYHHIVRKVARANRLDPWLLHAIIQHESSYNRFAESNKGAQGLMQLMPDTQKELGVINPWDPVQNINGGARYYRMMLGQFNGSYRTALLAYNAGPGKVQRGEIPQESQRYAAAVLATWQRLKKNRQ